VVDPLPSVPTAPSGTWGSVNWTALPATPEFGANVSAAGGGSTFQVFGWSRGYVGFAINPNNQTLVSSYSTDGVHWHAGQTLDPAAADSSGLMMIRTVVESPAGLLAVGWTGGCGEEYVDSLWTSPDGISWQPEDMGPVFGHYPIEVTRISGGAAGYVAVGYDLSLAVNSVPAHNSLVWTSKDGRNWQRVALEASPFKNSAINDGVSISGGFVLAGTSGLGNCGYSVEPGETTSAAPAPAPVLTPTVWWSADGSTWTRKSLPGAVATDDGDTWACSVSDQAMLVVFGVGDSSHAWGSKDGRNWIRVKLPPNIAETDIITTGQHNLVVKPATAPDATVYYDVTSGPLLLRTIDDSFAVSSVIQTGDVPNLVYYQGGNYTYGLVAIGPTGVVVTNADGSQLWFGTPSAK